MKNIFSRRDFVSSGALVGAAIPASKHQFAATGGRPPANEKPAIRLGVASYTFPNFSRAQLIGFLKQLNVAALNAKDVKDHLPMDAQEEEAGLADYAAEGVKLPAGGTIYFAGDEDEESRSKVYYG